MKPDYIIVAIFVLFIIVIGIRSQAKNRHKTKQVTADNIIQKIATLQHPGQKIAYLRKVDPYAFEELILTLLQRKGFVIARNERYSGDGGIDGRFKHNNEVWLIQAKRYASRIRQEHVSDFAVLLQEQGCKGIFVHTGTTPASVRNYIKNETKSHIEIISGDRLLKLFDTSLKLQF
ncbi:TPA: restriction endonuclease [Citrobacter freundii]|uniref:Restriction endonuclease n=2 Tax=Citrobacter freundii complex TaxID=1344959 RepID=A0AAD1TXT3_CITFR|nr:MULTISPECIES: restriction endonuclease [Enterobacteriaceae]ELE2066210.1 restriction endonuclease [Citrobacter freundii]MBA8133025.1 restriction endonuclease [Citrobacter sp. RHBSTW-00013]MBY1059804.1 restriction endonuclease [Citrobacter europaeus]MDE9616170.1 restriction endonuclease [Citrobacter portucalensis]MDF6026565.1 restriction endonuclease [Escherichia coli]